MKQKFVLILFSVFSFALATQAQIGKGSIWLGGSAGYNRTKSNIDYYENNKNEVFTFSPAVGKAIKENLVAGIRLSYSNSKQKNTSYSGGYNDTETKGYGGGIFLRRYVPVITRLYIFGEGTASYARTTRNEVHTGTKIKGWSTGIGFTPGISYGVNKKLQLESGFNSLLHASYGKSKSTAGYNHLSSDAFSAGVSLENESTFYIGFRLLLNNKG